MKRTLDAHPSVVVVFSERTGELLLSGYGGDFPKKGFIYRSTPNILGGNPTHDNSPYETMTREIAEEFDPNLIKQEGHNVASLKDILFIRDAITDNITPFSDFYFNVGQIEGGDSPYSAIASVYSAEVPHKVIETVRENISAGKKIVSEGWVGIHNLQQLAIAGERSTARLTAPILRSFFNSSPIPMPYPKEINFEQLGPIRPSYTHYETDFDYSVDQNGKPKFRKY